MRIALASSAARLSYVLLSFLIAISVTFPVFMAVRQRHWRALARVNPPR